MVKVGKIMVVGAVVMTALTGCENETTYNKEETRSRYITIEQDYDGKIMIDSVTGAIVLERKDGKICEIQID